MRLGIATLAALAALAAAVPAHASTPVPWCGTTPSATDLLPDSTRSYAVHVAYVRGPGQPDRFAEWAPRIVGDVAAMDQWWRGQDPTRSLRFDLFPAAGCSTPYGALDLTSAELPQGIGSIGSAFQTLRLLVASELGFREPEKAYLIYYDGSTGQRGSDRVCGQGAEGGGFGLPGLAVVYLDSCTAETGDSLRPIVAVHELVHVFGAVSSAAPHHCNDGHVCDAPNDLETASLTGEELDALALDVNRDDYYGHAGAWLDVRKSFFLERLDGPDRTPPATPTGIRAGDDPTGLVQLSWKASADDVGPVAYRVYQDTRFIRQLTTTSLVLTSNAGGTTQYTVRAVDAVGRLSAAVSTRFRDGVGMVDATGRLVRDTVRPPAVRNVRVRKQEKVVRLTWPAVRDAGGIRGYRLKIGKRSLFLRRPAVALARSRLAAVTIAAVDRAGNVGPETALPLSRLK